MSPPYISPSLLYIPITAQLCPDILLQSIVSKLTQCNSCPDKSGPKLANRGTRQSMQEQEAGWTQYQRYQWFDKLSGIHPSGGDRERWGRRGNNSWWG